MDIRLLAEYTFHNSYAIYMQLQHQKNHYVHELTIASI